MIIPEQKIQIFISSACGDEPEKQKYKLVREALKGNQWKMVNDEIP